MNHSATNQSTSRNGVPTAPDPEVKPKKATRRSFSAKQKLKVLEETDGLETGEIGAYLRRKGLYWSALSRWRKARDEGLLAAMAPRKRGAPPRPPHERRVAELEREVDRLRRKLDQAEKIIEVQKKLCELIGAPPFGKEQK